MTAPKRVATAAGTAASLPWETLTQSFWQWASAQLNPVTPAPAPTPAPTPTPAPEPAPTPAPASGYTFADEFDEAAGTPPDPTKWVYDLGGGGWGNGELEVYTSSTTNAYQDGNSNLVIAATKTGSGSSVVYDSARIKTLGKFSQLGGSFEARIQLNSQQGLWPAFWMMGINENWPMCGEVDILEDYGHSQIQTTVHTPDGTTSTYAQDANLASDTDWHIYRLDWDLDAETFTFYRDGTEYFTANSSQFPASSWVYGPATPNNGGMYFLLNVAVGGFVGTPDPVSWPVTMLVDYVHAWQ